MDISKFSQSTQGVIYCLLHASTWAFFPVLTKLTLVNLSPLASLTASSFFTLLAFAIAMSVSRKWHEVKVRGIHLAIFGHAITNGVLFYVVLFWGTSLTTAGNVAILLLLEVLFAMLILGGSGLERLTRLDLIGGALMALGAGLVVAPENYNFNIGDLLIVIATIIPIVGNYWSKLVRQKVSAVTIMFGRALIAAPILFALTLCTEQMPTIEQLSAALPVCALLGFFVLGITRIWWIESIHRIPIPRTNSISSITPLLTLALAYLLLNEIPTLRQCLAVIPMMFGLQLLVRAGKKDVNN